MRNSSASYLRVHRGEDLSAALESKLSTADSFWTAFSAATGWRVDSQHSADPVTMLPAVEMDLMGDHPADWLPPVVEENAKALAFQASMMADEIGRLQRRVARQEVELAAHSVAEIEASESTDLSNRVQQTIEQAIAGTGFDAAAVYLLDDETEFLHTRAVIGLPEDRIGSDPRPLRGSRADLEALVQDVVLIDDLSRSDAETWNVPEECGAAICTAILKGDLPIGTFWLFSDRPRQLGSSEAAIIQLASARITLELSDAVRTRRQLQSQVSHRAIAEVAEWQFTSLAAGNQLAPGWFVDGMIESPKPWSVGWHHWDVLPDGTLMIALAEAADDGSKGAMIAASARAALTAHCGYRHTPRQIVQRVGDTMWQTNSADQLISFLYAKVDPETGYGEVAAAGDISGLIASDHGYRPLIASGSSMLGETVNVDLVESTFELRSDETLLIHGAGMEADGVRQDMLGRALKSAMQDRENPLAVIRREIAALPNKHERGLLTVTRRCERKSSQR